MPSKGYFQKAIDKAYVKFLVPLNEKTYKTSDKDIHYLLYKNKKNKTLIVCFQAFNAKGPRYNYISSLAGIDADRLYIKDDFVEKTGNYYLGSDGNFNEEKSVYELINNIITAGNYDKLIFIGSSKGGYAAINFGVSYLGSVMIVAAPQYYLGSYMTETTKFHIALEDILGKNYLEKDVKNFDARLSSKILCSVDSTQKVYIHCSVNEETYENHCKGLIEDLERTEREVIFDKETYKEHWRLKEYFPSFLKESIKKEIV